MLLRKEIKRVRERERERKRSVERPGEDMVIEYLERLLEI
jgi:hypothetical protein